MAEALITLTVILVLLGLGAFLEQRTRREVATEEHVYTEPSISPYVDGSAQATCEAGSVLALPAARERSWPLDVSVRVVWSRGARVGPACAAREQR